MKKRTVQGLALLLALLVLAGCAGPEEKPVQPPEEPKVPVEDVTEPQRPDEPVQESRPEPLDHLAVELVVDWSDSERVLGALSEMQRLLGDALLAVGYQVEEISVTISTAGGFTANAMMDGGVDLAFMPAVDYITCESGAAAVLTTGEEPCETVVAVSLGREELGDSFPKDLETALLETEPGIMLLTLYRADKTYLPAGEEAIQAVRDWLEEQEER